MASELIEKMIYGDTIHIIHDPNARGRAPRYKVDGTAVKGVTTILGAVLAKDLMGWAVSCAIDYIRNKLPIVTEEDLLVAEKEHTVKRDSGASTGTEAHALVENYLKGLHEGKTFSEEPSAEAANAYSAFVKWFTKAKPEVINVEEVIYSEKYNYGGTYDCLLKIDGKIILGDYKTTNASRKAPNGIYSENFVQLGAYALAHEEQRQYELANGGTKLLKIDDLAVMSGKKDGKFDYCTASELGLTVADCGNMFKSIVNLYNFLNYTTAKLGGK